MRHLVRLRRASALSMLLLFLFGNNFCLLSVPLAGACPIRDGHALAASRAPVHACCVAAAAKKQRADQATREATAPCCVAVSATVAPHAASLEAAPMNLLAVLPPALYSTGAVDFARAVPVGVVPAPPPRAATPDAGRPSPRL